MEFFDVNSDKPTRRAVFYEEEVVVLGAACRLHLLKGLRDGETSSAQVREICTKDSNQDLSLTWDSTHHTFFLTDLVSILREYVKDLQTARLVMEAFGPVNIRARIDLHISTGLQLAETLNIEAQVNSFVSELPPSP